MWRAIYAFLIIRAPISHIAQRMMTNNATGLHNSVIIWQGVFDVDFITVAPPWRARF